MNKRMKMEVNAGVNNESEEKHQYVALWNRLTLLKQVTSSPFLNSLKTFFSKEAWVLGVEWFFYVKILDFVKKYIF